MSIIFERAQIAPPGKSISRLRRAGSDYGIGLQSGRGRDLEISQNLRAEVDQSLETE